jgi:hypothetical protein
MPKTLNSSTTTLAELVGRKTLALIPWIDLANAVDIEVHGVETGGIWIECQTLTDKVLSGACAGVSEVTPVFFFPFSMFAFIAGVAGRPAVSRNISLGEIN